MTDLSRFADRLDRYGASLAAWPGRERAWAEALLQRSEPARAALERAEEFDRAMRDAAPDVHAEAIRRAVLDALPPHAAGATAVRVRAAWWTWAGGFGAAAASLVLCFYLGTASPQVWPERGPQAGAGDSFGGIDSMIFGIGFEGDGA